eukprot:TRINITY_DN66667_c0_g1_i1.p2 TRINITY_DN66667_c0_g1~~TRINITY_DN66667_c0_g1_i1.p2  ORF type:complete len:126 (+),score=19.99 TRINITY_DN66667_c0_g1_i1:67-444(+)
MGQAETAVWCDRPEAGCGCIGAHGWTGATLSRPSPRSAPGAAAPAAAAWPGRGSPDNPAGVQTYFLHSRDGDAPSSTRASGAGCSRESAADAAFGLSTFQLAAANTGTWHAEGGAAMAVLETSSR